MAAHVAAYEAAATAADPAAVLEGLDPDVAALLAVRLKDTIAHVEEAVSVGAVTKTTSVERGALEDMYRVRDLIQPIVERRHLAAANAFLAEVAR